MNTPGPDAVEPESNRTPVQALKDIALFFAAPFITMAWLALFPFIGARLLVRDWHRRKNAG